MSPERWRCFVAIPLPDELRHELAAAVEVWHLRPHLAGLRWTDPGSWHVTLAFIGSLDAAGIPELVARLTDAAERHAPMHLPMGGVGGFPSAARARVAWYGVDDTDGALATLTADVRRAAGVDAAAAFGGHVTLARARRQPVDLRSWISAAVAPRGQLAVERIELMRSHLGRGPARYEVVASLPVGVRVHV